MNTELLSCKSLTTGLLIPARQFQQAELNKLYASVTEQYPFQALQHLPDGIRMANPENDIIIQGGMPPNPGRLQINDNNIFHFNPAKERALHLFEMVTEHLGIQQFLTFGVKLNAFLPTDGPTATEVIESSALSSFRPVLDSLGTGRQGAGFRVVLNNSGVFDLKVEPFFADLSQIFVELDVQYTEPLNGLDAVEAQMNRAYDFFDGNVREMLGKMG